MERICANPECDVVIPPDSPGYKIFHTVKCKLRAHYIANGLRNESAGSYCECGKEKPRGQIGCDSCRAIDKLNQAFTMVESRHPMEAKYG